ncbi:MAG: pantoate--beta-alanine ligase [Phycisphaeraceae bacterium]
MTAMRVVETVSELREVRSTLSGRLAVVPTMGALHDGHMRLVERAHELAEHVWVTIFVNPTQFGPNEDLSRYPRDLEGDLARCERAGVELVFVPAVEEVYPPGLPEVLVTVPALAGELEGAARPTHFAGVCRVVAKLLNMTRPDVACFGRKDYQQLAVVRALVGDLAMGVEVAAVATVREGDGLAMSSRNRYLGELERPKARAIYCALTGAVEGVGRGEREVGRLESGMRQVLIEQGFEVDYAVVRDGVTLGRLERVEGDGGGAVALIAARLGGVRLIDNMMLDGG